MNFVFFVQVTLMTLITPLDRSAALVLFVSKRTYCVCSGIRQIRLEIWPEPDSAGFTKMAEFRIYRSRSQNPVQAYRTRVKTISDRCGRWRQRSLDWSWSALCRRTPLTPPLQAGTTRPAVGHSRSLSPGRDRRGTGGEAAVEVAGARADRRGGSRSRRATTRDRVG